MHLDSAYRWARDTEDARIGLAGTTAGFLQYGFYGTDLSNRVVYLGEKGPHGAFNAIPTCRGFRAAVNAADLDYLVTAPFLNFIHPGTPVPSPEAGWLRGEPRSPILAAARSPSGGSGTSTRAAAANAPLREIPTRGWVTSSRSYPLENALFQWEEGTASCGVDDPRARRADGRRRGPGRAAPRSADLRRRAGRALRAGHRLVPAGRDRRARLEGDAQSLADAAFWLYLRGHRLRRRQSPELLVVESASVVDSARRQPARRITIWSASMRTVTSRLPAQCSA